MTPEQILELAKEHDMIDSRGNWSFDLIPFALAVAQRTRDECADLCDALVLHTGSYCAVTIRSMTE